MAKTDQVTTTLLLFAAIVKDVKKRLPKACTFLSPLKTIKGEFQVRAVIHKEEIRVTTPDLLNFTDADVTELHTLLLEKC